MGEVALYINGDRQNFNIGLFGNISESIMSTLRQYKTDPNHSIIAIYNESLRELDILFGKNDINSAYLLSNIIKNYHGDLLDIDIFGITNTTYMTMFLESVQRQINILRKQNKREKGIGLVKRDR